MKKELQTNNNQVQLNGLDLSKAQSLEELHFLNEQIEQIKAEYSFEKEAIITQRELDKTTLSMEEYRTKYPNVHLADLINPLVESEAQDILDLKVNTLINAKKISYEVAQDAFMIQQYYIQGVFKAPKIDADNVLSIVAKLPKYTHDRLKEALEKLFCQTNTYGKPIKCIDYYADDLFKYPAYLLDKLFATKFNDFPSIQQMHEVIKSKGDFAQIINKVLFGD